MLKVVKNLGEENDIPVQLLMEERMACGMGACLVCTCKVKKGEDDWNYVRTCKEGPVFYGEEVIFDEESGPKSGFKWTNSKKSRYSCIGNLRIRKGVYRLSGFKHLRRYNG
jgi:hypothetical protein